MLRAPAVARVAARAHSRAPAAFTYKIGARVRCTRNLYRTVDGVRKLWIANQQLGTVHARLRFVEAEVFEELDDDEQPNAFDTIALRIEWDAVGVQPARMIALSPEMYRRRQSAYLAARITGDFSTPVVHLRAAFPLALAFARTLHSAQGDTLRAPADLDLWHSRRDTPGTTYVALSRFARAEFMRFVGYPGKLPFDEKCCLADPAVRRFYAGVAERPRPAFLDPNA